MSNYTIIAGCASKIGPRQRNDDYAACSATRSFYAVADGIGGAPHGDAASACAVNAALAAFEEDGLLLSAFRLANEAVMQICTWLASPETGTTLLLAACEDTPHGPEAHFAWAGDTMAYLLRDGKITSVTSPNRVDDTNALTAAVGYTQDVRISESTCDIRSGDRLVLCTDGVWETLGERRLAELLGSCDNAPWLAESITREASEHGRDNATAVVLIAEEAPEDAFEETPAETLSDKPESTPSSALCNAFASEAENTPQNTPKSTLENAINNTPDATC